MSLYSKSAKIDGLRFGLVMRGAVNGQYVIVFERECATLEQIEGINWEQPTLEGDCILPAGYGFELEGITYCSSDLSYRVTVHVARQFWGDVTGYQAQISALQAEKTELAQASASQQAQITALQEQLAEADETLIAMYEARMSETESPGIEPQETEPSETEPPAAEIGEEEQT